MKSRSWSGALRSFVDPMTYFQAVRLLHYYSYSHVRPAAAADHGRGRDDRAERLAPKRRADRHRRAARRSASAPTSGRATQDRRIKIGEDCRFGPEVFVTASDYGLSPDAKIAEQERNERDIDDRRTTSGSAPASSSAPASRSATAASSAPARWSRKSLPPGSIAVGDPARDRAPARGLRREAGDGARAPGARSRGDERAREYPTSRS